MLIELEKNKVSYFQMQLSVFTGLVLNRSVMALEYIFLDILRVYSKHVKDSFDGKSNFHENVKWMNRNLRVFKYTSSDIE